MQQIGTITYPSTMIRVITDTKLRPVLVRYLRAMYAEENIQFILADLNPKVLYRKHIRAGSPSEINIGSELREEADEIASRNAWSKADWTNVVKKCKEETLKQIESNFGQSFFKSNEFKAYHLKNGGSQSDFDPAPVRKPTPVWERAADHFSIKDVDKMKKYISAFETRGTDETLNYGTKFIREQGLRIGIRQFNEELVKHNFATRKLSEEKSTADNSHADEDNKYDKMEKLLPPLGNSQNASPPVADDPVLEIKLYPKKLKDCGFLEFKKEKNLALITEMLRAHNVKNQPDAIKLYNLLLKKFEPKNSPLQNIPFVELMKIMRKNKAYDVVQMA